MGNQMIFNNNERVVSFDCDDTLVMWGDDFYQPNEGRIAILDPNDGKTMYLTPHALHIRKLKGYHQSGWFVIIWSAGGGAWANAVAKALELEEHCSLITAKPSILFDDQPLNNAFGERKYWQPKKGYK